MMNIYIEAFLVGFFSSLIGGLSVALPIVISDWLERREDRKSWHR